MAPHTSKILPFPVRNPYIPARSHDSLARDLQTRDTQLDTQRHASRIAQQVEQEIARQAARMATGARQSRVSRPVLMMPASIVVETARAGRLERATAAAKRLFGAFSGPVQI